MKSVEMTLQKIVAEEGMLIRDKADGTVLGKVVYIGEGRTADDFDEVLDESEKIEADKIYYKLKNQNESEEV